MSDVSFSYRGDHITLGQLLKALDVLGSGGEARSFLQQESVLVNGEVDRQRGRKLRDGDTVALSDGRTVRIKAKG